MRQLVPLVLLFSVAIWYLCQVEQPQVVGQTETQVSEADSWVRTIDGWQRKSELTTSRSVYLPPLHPLLVALIQGLLSLLALLVFPASRWQKAEKNS